uniref:Uncharacterized protein n=1 Tax=Solanum lycopersicum TaxID=4081 RepID=A0A3Q7IV09_SOLLC
MEETEENTGVHQLEENSNGEIVENEKEVGQKEVDGNEESNETKEEAEVGETEQNPDGEIVENEEDEDEDEKERKRRDIKQGKQPMYKEGGPFKDYDEKNEGTKFDLDKWSW